MMDAWLYATHRGQKDHEERYAPGARDQGAGGCLHPLFLTPRDCKERVLRPTFCAMALPSPSRRVSTRILAFQKKLPECFFA